jgi:FMN phosphatase YigB (HAD superfamily)
VALSDTEAVLFDMGGTLVDYPVPSWPVMAGRCIEGVYGYIVRPERELHPSAAAVPGPQEARALRAAPAPHAAVPHRIMLALRRMVRSLSGRTLPRMAEACARPLVAGARLFDDTMPVLRAIKSRGYRLALVSNTPWGTPEYLWESQVRRFSLEPYFEVRLFSSVFGLRKPDARIFQAALDGLGIAAARAVFIGDNPEADILGAAGAGMRTVLIERPGRAAHTTHKEDARRGAAAKPDIRIRSLAELLDHLPDRAPLG